MLFPIPIGFLHDGESLVYFGPSLSVVMVVTKAPHG